MKIRTITLEIDEHIAYLTINNPPANSLNIDTLDAFAKCLDHIENEPMIKAVILTGAGKHFVAGADIKEFQDAFGDIEKGKDMSQQAQSLFTRLENLQAPVIAAINGTCLGGGFELAMNCHLRIASEEAVLGLPELNLGLIPGYGGTQKLARLTNSAIALEMILTSKQINGAQAASMGIVNFTVNKGQVMESAVKMAKTIANQKSAPTVSAALTAVTKGINISMQDGLLLENELFSELFKTEDMKEGVKAFIEKREPLFHDK